LTVHTGPMVLQVEDHRIHRTVSLAEHSARLIQNKTGYQTQDPRAIIGVVIVDLAGSGSPQVLEETQDLFQQSAPRPDAPQPRGGHSDSLGPGAADARAMGHLWSEQRLGLFGHRPKGRHRSICFGRARARDGSRERGASAWRRSTTARRRPWARGVGSHVAPTRPGSDRAGLEPTPTYCDIVHRRLGGRACARRSPQGRQVCQRP
jgi:hypothetical protein